MRRGEREEGEGGRREEGADARRGAGEEGADGRREEGADVRRGARVRIED